MSPEIKLNIHPVNFIIISGILQSIILAGILVFRRNGNKYANRFIGFVILIFSLHFSWTLIIDTNLADIFEPVSWIPYSFILAIGPMTFFYAKSLTTADFRIGSKELTHFLPVVAEVLIQLYIIKESIQQNILFYDVKGFLWFRMIELIGTVSSILIYGKQCLTLIRIHEARMSENFSNQKDFTLLWLSKLIRYLRVLWIFWMAFELSFIFFWQFQMHFISVYLLLYLLLGVTAYSNYWIGIQALIRSEHLIEKTIVNIPLENVNVYARLKEGDIKGHVEAIDQLMQKEKMYLHETLSLRTLAKRLQMDPNLVSYLLNSVLKKSFYDYVNEFRIEEVKRKIDDPDNAHLKIVEIAYECGFNSKATFNRVFKKFTGKSPSSYRAGS